MENINPRPETSPKDFFLHLLSIVALYVSATSFSTLLFQLVNAWFPDMLVRYGSPFSASAIRWSVAMFVVFFPSYVATNIFLSKEYRAHPEKRNLRIRKWLVYFTLFAAALFILGDLVALILNFMQGELTTRFLLKVFVIFFVAGLVFGYYLRDLKGAASSKGMRALVYTISVIGLAVAVAGFFVAGSPYEERARRFDEQRVSDLSMIQSDVVNYWTRTGTIPDSLDMLRDDLRGVLLPTDPETGSVYAYRKTGDHSFSICAVFTTEYLSSVARGKTPARVVYSPSFSSWQHGKGEVCFDRTIDPKLYPPQKE